MLGVCWKVSCCNRRWWELRVGVTEVIDLLLCIEQCGRIGGQSQQQNLLISSFTEIIEWQIQDKYIRKRQSNYRNK